LTESPEAKAMSRDTLSDVLRAVRLRGAVFYYVDGAAPWVAEAPAAREIIPGIMPGVDHLIEFHGVVEGSCWAATAGLSPVRLVAGDLVLFPQGDAHAISSAPGLRAPHVDKDFFFAPRPAQLPYSISVSGDEVTTARLEGGGERSTVACGFLGLDARPFNPLLASLPRLLHVPGSALGPDSWVATFLRAVVLESNHRRPGGEAVLERMSEMLFVEVLRRYADGLPPGQTGWLAAMRDPSVGRALAAIHEKPAEPWTLERLGEEAALSRSTLHERFSLLLGQPPMQYLARWRMQVAAGLLRDTTAKLVDVALRVGYDSEAAFCRAGCVAPGGAGTLVRPRQAASSVAAGGREGSTRRPAGP
jgi:AraC-like DNA-binding protein